MMFRQGGQGMTEAGEKTLLEVRNLHKTYGSWKRKPVYALDGVSFSLQEGCCLGVVGESGCGKSTLCRVIAGIERQDRGEVLYEGSSMDYKKRRNSLQMVFQNSMDAVNIHLRVGDIIAEPLENFTSLNRTQREQEVGRLLELVGLSVEDRIKYPRQFSGGQLQRICIARALAADPRILLLDEPLSSLDVSVQAQLLNLLWDLKKEFKLTCLLVSHDLEAVYYLADKLLVMYGGAVVEELVDIRDFARLRHPYTRRLIEAGALEEEGWEVVPERAGILGRKESSGGLLGKGCVYAKHCPRAKESCFERRPVLSQWEAGHKIACHLST